MDYYIYRLKFETPVRFGSDSKGADLNKGNITAHADTLFSAICNELALKGDTYLDEFISMVNNEELWLSDLFPYRDEELFLPKPIVQRQSEMDNIPVAPHIIKEKVSAQKKLKKLKYISVDNLEKYTKILDDNNLSSLEMPDFGMGYLQQRVNNREAEPLPYHVHSHVFNSTSGLYFIVQTSNQDCIYDLNIQLEELGMSGIGGKRSSGYGKFQVLHKGGQKLEENATNKSEQILYKMLHAEQANTQMLVSVLAPHAEDIATVKAGNYLSVLRSGFAYSPYMEGNALKRNNVYMLAPGSCFAKRIKGQLLTMDHPCHSVYRYARGMFVGLNL